MANPDNNSPPLPPSNKADTPGQGLTIPSGNKIAAAEWNNLVQNVGNLTPAYTGSAALNAYAAPSDFTTAHWILRCDGAPSGATTYKWAYVVEG
jgi:hypothetical protein